MSLQDKALRTCVNLYHPAHADVQHIVDLCNDFVQRHRQARAAAPAMPMLALCRGQPGAPWSGVEECAVVDVDPPDATASLPAVTATPLRAYVDGDDRGDAGDALGAAPGRVCHGGACGSVRATPRFSRLGLERLVVVDPATVTVVPAM